MSILLIHGDDTHASRNFLHATLQKIPPDTEKLVLDGAKLSIEDFEKVTQSQSLFAQKKYLHIDDFAKNKSQKVKKYVFTQLKDAIPKDVDILFWESKRLTPAQAKKYAADTVKEFKHQAIIFEFLDQLRPNNQKMLTGLYAKLTASEPAEKILFMIMRHMTELIQAKAGTLSGPQWKKDKLKRQSSQFSSDVLRAWTTKLLDVEHQFKSGLSSQKIESSLSIFLLTH